jgi:hypothetical protein
MDGELNKTLLASAVLAVRDQREYQHRKAKQQRGRKQPWYELIGNQVGRVVRRINMTDAGLFRTDSR